MSRQAREWLTKAFFLTMELLSLGLVMLLATWYAQRFTPVVELLEPAQVTAVTRAYVEVRWHAQLVTDCPGRVEPAFVTDYATEALPSYPFIVEHTPKIFVRRYPIPPYLVAMHDTYHQALREHEPPIELRVQMIAECNPLWPTRQWLRVPFDIPVSE